MQQQFLNNNAGPPMAGSFLHQGWQLGKVGQSQRGNEAQRYADERRNKNVMQNREMPVAVLLTQRLPSN